MARAHPAAAARALRPAPGPGGGPVDLRNHGGDHPRLLRRLTDPDHPHPNLKGAPPVRPGGPDRRDQAPISQVTKQIQKISLL